MKNRCINMGMPVLAALFAISIALVSCAEDPIFDMDWEILGGLLGDKTMEKIDECIKNPLECPDDYEEPEPIYSSSSEQNGDQSSDSQAVIQSSSSEPPPPPPSSSSAAPPTPSSSSARSSSSAGSNSQSSSSGGGSGNSLTCTTALPTSATVGANIVPPTVKCGDTNVASSNVTWAGTPSAPNWGNLAAGTYTSVKATATCGGSSQTANCSGTLTVSAPSSSSAPTPTPSSSSAPPVASSSSTPPTPPSDKCTPTKTISIPQGEANAVAVAPGCYTATLASGGGSLVCNVCNGGSTGTDGVKVIGKYETTEMSIPAHNCQVAVGTNGATSAVIEINSNYTNIRCRKDW